MSQSGGEPKNNYFADKILSNNLDRKYRENNSVILMFLHNQIHLIEHNGCGLIHLKIGNHQMDKFRASEIV